MQRFILAAVLLVAGAGSSRAEDWVIGASDPNEVVTQTTDRTVDGDIVIVNNARLEIQGATLTVAGDINVLNSAALNATGASIRFVQSFSYERTLYADDDATVRFLDVVVDTGGTWYAYFVTLVGTATADFERVTVVTGQPSAMAYSGKGGSFPVVR